MAGYSSTPLAKKLGIRPGNSIRLINQPQYYTDLFTDWPEAVVQSGAEAPYHFIHFFSSSYNELLEILADLKGQLFQNGMIWVSWPKKSSGVLTDITENKIRDHALAIGLVDVKVCAVDDTWSGLKLVIPVKDRIK